MPTITPDPEVREKHPPTRAKLCACSAVILIGIPFATWILGRDWTTPIVTFFGLIGGVAASRIWRAWSWPGRKLLWSELFELAGLVLLLVPMVRDEPPRSLPIAIFGGLFGLACGVLTYHDLERGGWISQEFDTKKGTIETVP